MNKEEKQLLLQDLCARLPYGVKVCIKLPNHQEKIFEEQIGDLEELTIYGGYLVNLKGIDYRSFNLDIKPYLRPMTSMTYKEWEDYQKIRMIDWVQGDIDGTFINAGLIVDWLNAHHFDYRNLIERGLAIAVTEENNPYET